MIGIIVATRAEADPLIGHLEATGPTDGPFESFRLDDGVIVVSGMGKQNAAAATEYLIDQHAVTTVINVGICGALRDNLSPGTLVQIHAAIDGDDDLPAVPVAHAERWSALPVATLATVDEPVFDSGRRDRLARGADVVDMEGFAVVDVCRRRDIPVHLIKGISDGADDTGHRDLHANIAAVSIRLAEAVAAALAAPPAATSRVATILNFAKIEHSIFSLPLLLAGALVGGRGSWPPWHIIALILIAGVSARALGMAMNRILDRKLDALNPRTAGRELPAGRMSVTAAWSVAGVGLAVYLLACAMLGPICLKLSPIPAAALIGYSLLKRVTPLCHFGIGLALALAPLGAFVAVTGGTAFGANVLLLTTFTFCWISGFDIIYALMDVESDRRTGVRSIPAAVGPRAAQIVAAVVHGTAVAALIGLWYLLGMTAGSTGAAIVAIGGFIAAYWTRLPLPVRFFPVSAIAGVAGAMVVLLGAIR